MKRMNKVIAFSALAALTLGANSIQAGAYGETTEKSTLTADTKGVADYQTWKEKHGPASSPLIQERLP